VLTIIIISGLLGIIAMVSMSTASETPYLDEVLGWKNLIRQVLNLFVTTVFLYYSLNYYYDLIAQRKPFI
jgi:hypothetical protein